jgi:Cof subfamily protein (haloacid dehalogenase superfamily)
MSISADPRTIKALAMDLDGTLLAPGAVLSDRTIKAVKACRERGLQIIITTGRAIEAAEPFRASLGAEGPMVYYNGAIVADMPGNRILSSTLMDRKAVGFCVDFAREMGLYCQAYFPSGDFCDGNCSDGNASPRIILKAEREGPEREMYYKHTGLLAELVDLKKELRRPGLHGCVKAMFLAEPEVLAEIRPRLEGHFKGSVYIAQTLRTFLELMNVKASKGQGLKFVMERCSLKREEVIAFGDEESDLTMFAVAGFSAAPSNAKDSVKAQADTVTGSNAEDGVAAFLEDFFLK